MQKAQQKVNEFTERKDHAEILQKLKDNPEDPEAKRIWTEFRSILELIGGMEPLKAADVCRKHLKQQSAMVKDVFF